MRTLWVLRSTFSLNSARLRTLPHIPCAVQDLDLGAPDVGSDVIYLAGHSSACCGHAAGSGGSAGYMRGTLVSWPHDCGCAAVRPEGGGAVVAAHRVYSDCGIGIIVPQKEAHTTHRDREDEIELTVLHSCRDT